MYSFPGRIRYSECDEQGRLGLLSLLNYFQDCSTFQSEDLGVGLDYLRENDLVWVLSSWQIAVDRYPRCGERVETGTAPYEFKGCFGYRNFWMRTGEGETLARANSLWTLLYISTMMPARPPKRMLEVYQVEPRLEMDYAGRKIQPAQGGTEGEPITVCRHHLDTNCHVNNGQYVDMAMNLLPMDFAVSQLRAEYKMQAHLGDVLIPYVVSEPGKYVISLRDGEGKPYVNLEFAGRNGDDTVR